MKKILFLSLAVIVACNAPKQHGLVYFNDFESMKGWAPINLSKRIVHSGIFSNKLDSVHVYGATFKMPVKEITPNRIVKVKVSFWVYLFSKSKGKLVLDIKNEKDSLVYWIGKDISGLVPKTGEWQQAEITLVLPGDAIAKADNVIGIYPWNVGKEDFYIDDFRIEFIPEMDQK